MPILKKDTKVSFKFKQKTIIRGEASINNITHFSFFVKEIEYAPEWTPCPQCGTESHRDSRAERCPRDINLEHPLFLLVTVGVYQCPNNGCEVNYFRIPLPFAKKGAHYTLRAMSKCIESVRRDHMPFSSVPERAKKDFHISPSRSTVWRWYREEGDNIDLAPGYEGWVGENFSGVLCVDEVYDGDFCLLLATDPLNQMTVAFLLEEKAHGQKKTQATQEQVGRLFDYIKEMGINPEVIVSDGSPLYPEVIAQKFPGARHQLCRFHIIQDIVREILKAIREYRKGLPSPPKRKRGRPKEGEPPPPPDRGKEIYKHRHLFVTRPDKLEEDKEGKQILERLCQEHKFLKTLRSFMEEVFSIFEQTTAEEAKQRYNSLVQKQEYQKEKPLKKTLQHLSEDKIDKALVFLNYQQMNSTNNDVERAARRFRKIQKSHYRLRSRASIICMLRFELIAQKAKWEKKDMEARRLCRLEVKHQKKQPRAA